MNNIPKVKVKLYISGSDLKPEDVTEILKTKPTVSKSIDEFPVNSLAVPFWALKTEWVETYDVSEVCQQFVNKLKNKEKLIKNIVSKYNYKTRFVVDILITDLIRPEVLLGRETLNFVNRINADIAIDLLFD